MDVLVFKAFWPEFFLSLSIIFLLLFNSYITNNLNYKFPILEKEIFVQVYTILFYVFLLFSNNKIIGYDTNFFFISDLCSQNLKFFFSGFCLLFFVIIWRSFVIQKLNFFEYFIIVLLVILSLDFLASSFNLLSIYLCLELQAISFYVLASFQRNSIFSSEAGLKYFISSSLVSGIFLLGCAFIYGSYGTVNLHHIYILNTVNLLENYQYIMYFVTVGSFLIIGAFLFKLVVAPFHFWFPQIYDGAPLASTIIFSTFPKIIVMSVFLRFWSVFFPILYFSKTILFLIGIFSVFFGILKGLKQKRLKKLYIYSSISQMGLCVCALADGSLESYAVMYFFLIVYLLTSILMWGTFVLINKNQPKEFLNSQSLLKAKNEIDVYSLFISKLNRLFNANIMLAFVFLCLLFSLGGIPPFAGFISKIYIYFTLMKTNKYEFSVIILYLSTFGVYYYIKILKIMFYENSLDTQPLKTQTIFNDYALELDYFICSLALFLLLLIGIFPNMVYLGVMQLVFYPF